MDEIHVAFTDHIHVTYVDDEHSYNYDSDDNTDDDHDSNNATSMISRIIAPENTSTWFTVHVGAGTKQQINNSNL